MNKVIVVIEVECERAIDELGEEITKRISMHPYVHDANVIAMSEGQTFPKPTPKAVTRNFIGTVIVNNGSQD